MPKVTKTKEIKQMNPASAIERKAHQLLHDARTNLHRAIAFHVLDGEAFDVDACRQADASFTSSSMIKKTIDALQRIENAKLELKQLLEPEI